MNGTSHPKNRPVHEVRFGTLKAAIWENRLNNDGPRYSVTFSRGYKDGEQWKNSEYFNRDDLLVVAKLADAAHSWIWSQRAVAPHPQNA